MSRCDQYRDLLERWSAWWNGPGREQFQGQVLPPLTDTAAVLTCWICTGQTGEGRCNACGRNLDPAPTDPADCPACEGTGEIADHACSVCCKPRAADPAPTGDDFCHHCGGGPLLACTYCSPHRTTTIDRRRPAVSEHLTPFESDRGFLYMPEIAGKHPGSKVETHQSSSAEGPHVWVGADDGETVVLVHLPAEQARQFAEQILWLLAPAAPTGDQT